MKSTIKTIIIFGLVLLLLYLVPDLPARIVSALVGNTEPRVVIVQLEQDREPKPIATPIIISGPTPEPVVEQVIIVVTATPHPFGNGVGVRSCQVGPGMRKPAGCGP